MTPNFQKFIKVLFFAFTEAKVTNFGCENIGKLTLIFFNVNQGQKERGIIQNILSSLMSDVTYYLYFLRKYMCIDRCRNEPNINQPILSNCSGAN